MKLLVLFGGPSREHDVSVSSARSIFKNLPKTAFSIDLLYLSHDLKCAFVKNPAKFPDLDKLMFSENFYSSLQKIRDYDKVFLALHGEFGEDGKIQAIFESCGISFTGSDSFSSALCMDKYRSSIFVEKLVDVKLPKSLLISNNKDLEKVWFPCIIKPNRAGSSVGVKILKSASDLNGLEINEEHVLQDLLSGIELSCGCLQSKHGVFTQLPPIEIVPKNADFFDYTSKYTQGMSNELCPPQSIDTALSHKISKLACDIHFALGCRTYSRSDFIVVNQEVYYLETNTLPGMTSTSLLPQECSVAGMSFSKMLDYIVIN